MNRARSSLAIVKKTSPDIYPEDLCYQAQQAADKAIIAIFLAKGIKFPYIHDITALLSRLKQHGVVVPDGIKEATILSVYASRTRYPGIDPPMNEEEYNRAVLIAESVVRWADGMIRSA